MREKERGGKRGGDSRKQKALPPLLTWKGGRVENFTTQIWNLVKISLWVFFYKHELLGAKWSEIRAKIPWLCDTLMDQGTGWTTDRSSKRGFLLPSLYINIKPYFQEWSKKVRLCKIIHHIDWGKIQLYSSSGNYEIMNLV